MTTAGRVLHGAARYDLLIWLITLGRERAFREKLAALIVSGLILMVVIAHFRRFRG